MTTNTYRPLSNGAYTYSSINRRLNQPTTIPASKPYQQENYNVAPTGTTTNYMDIYRPTAGQAVKSPVSGASIGMSQWGKPLTGALPKETYGQVLAQNPYVTRVISDEMTRYYGGATQVQLVDVVNKVVNEGMPLEQALALVKSGHQRNEDEIYAGSLISGQYDPAINARDRELDRLARQLELGINVQEGFGDKYDQRLQDISGALQGELGKNKDAVAALYDQVGQQTNKAYQQADTRMGEANDLIQSLMLESANSLGLQGAEARSFGELGQALADSRGINAAGQAGAVGNLANLGADMTGLATKAMSDSSREYADKRSQLVNEVMGNIARMQFEGAEQQNEVGGQIADLEQQRAADLRTALVDVRNARTERERQTALDQLAAEIQRGTLDLQRQQLGMNADQFGQSMQFDKERFEFEKQMQSSQLKMQQQELEAKLGQTQDPMERAYLQAQIDKMKAETARIEYELANPSANNPGYKGVEGVSQFLKQEGVPNGAEIATNFNNLWKKAAMTAANQSGTTPEAIFYSYLEKLPPQDRQLYYLLSTIMTGQYSSYR